MFDRPYRAWLSADARSLTTLATILALGYAPDLAAQRGPIPLEGITVEAGNPCRVRPEVGRPAARLWDQARKALATTSETRRKGQFRFFVRSFSHTIDPKSLRPVVDGTAWERTDQNTWPFISAPTEQLLEDGFVAQSPAGITYFAPDGDVLLSEQFLDKNCFAISLGADSSLIGLTFRPISEEGPPTVRGTLWMDRGTLALRFLDYGYTRLTLPGGAAAAARGRIEFEALPGGAWIVRRWWVRMPTRVTLEAEMTGTPIKTTTPCGPGCFEVWETAVDFESRISGVHAFVSGMREEGGEVLATLPSR